MMSSRLSESSHSMTRWDGYISSAILLIWEPSRVAQSRRTSPRAWKRRLWRSLPPSPLAMPDRFFDMASTSTLTAVTVVFEQPPAT